jgi:hypothetical protein
LYSTGRFKKQFELTNNPKSLGFNIHVYLNRNALDCWLARIFKIKDLVGRGLSSRKEKGSQTYAKKRGEIETPT